MVAPPVLLNITEPSGDEPMPPWCPFLRLPFATSVTGLFMVVSLGMLLGSQGMLPVFDGRMFSWIQM